MATLEVVGLISITVQNTVVMFHGVTFKAHIELNVACTNLPLKTEYHHAIQDHNVIPCTGYRKSHGSEDNTD